MFCTTYHNYPKGRPCCCYFALLMPTFTLVGAYLQEDNKAINKTNAGHPIQRFQFAVRAFCYSAIAG